MGADPIPVVLGKVFGFCDADAFHALHGENLWAGCSVVDGGDDEDVFLVLEEGSEALGCLCFTEVVTFPCKLHAGILDRLVQI